jgi:hypothetical protein
MGLGDVEIFVRDFFAQNVEVESRTRTKIVIMLVVVGVGRLGELS